MGEEEPSGDITLLLQAWRDGEPEALGQLMPLVYPRLRGIADSFLRREPRDGTLQATGLVHELYLVLTRQRRIAASERVHLFSLAAQLMRRILIDRARERAARKRGGEQTRVPLAEDLQWVDAASEEIIDLDRALEDLGRLDSRKLQLIEFRVFLGCSTEESAELAGISKATADRDLRFTRAWLFDRLRGGGASEGITA